MTTTELIKILQDNETGAISLKPREISLIINGRYMPNPQITLSSTGDGICGPEIDLDINGKWLEQEPIIDKIRAEIAELHLIGYATVDGKREIASRAVLEILDKYKAESEDKE